MITLLEITESLSSCTVHCKGTGFGDCRIMNIAAGDLMSEVLVAEEENLLLITALNTEQAIRTAHIVDACGVLLVNGKKPQAGMIRLAEEFDLSLVSTTETLYTACGRVFRLMSGEGD